MAELAAFRASDGYSIYLRRYREEAAPRGRIVFLHGIRSHGGWYERSCRQLTRAGFEVIFPDRRGAGLNTSHRGDCPSFRRLLDDAAELIRDLRNERPWMPIVLAGISWGGKLAAGLPYRDPGLVDGIALLCPGLCPKIRPGFSERLAIVRARLFNPTRRFPIPLNEPELFTADSQWRQFVDEDRFGLRSATARFLIASVSMDMYLRRAVRRIRVPTLLMLAEHDRVIDNAATRRLMANVQARSRTIIDYAGAHHTLEFEREDHPFVGDLIRWIERCVLGSRSEVAAIPLTPPGKE